MVKTIRMWLSQKETRFLILLLDMSFIMFGYPNSACKGELELSSPFLKKLGICSNLSAREFGIYSRKSLVEEIAKVICSALKMIF